MQFTEYTHYKPCASRVRIDEAILKNWIALDLIYPSGYGHSSPSTLGGRVFTIFYAIFGIPFMLGM